MKTIKHSKCINLKNVICKTIKSYQIQYVQADLDSVSKPLNYHVSKMKEYLSNSPKVANYKTFYSRRVISKKWISVLCWLIKDFSNHSSCEWIEVFNLINFLHVMAESKLLTRIRKKFVMIGQNKKILSNDLPNK